MNGPSPPPDSTRTRRGRMPEGWLVEAEGLVHIYKTAELEVVALQGLDLQLAEGETIAIAGRSGSGKTTLMNILAGVEAPDPAIVVFRLEDHGSFGLFKMHPDGSDSRPILGLSSFKPRFMTWGPRAEEDNR